VEHDFPHKAKELVTREIAGETIIVPIRNQAADLESVYTLNETATFVWQKLDGAVTVNQVAELLCYEYDVPPEVARADALDLVTTLRAEGLLRVVAPADDAGP
jgi:hypothetical protein